MSLNYLQLNKFPKEGICWNTYTFDDLIEQNVGTGMGNGKGRGIRVAHSKVEIYY